VKFLLDQDVPDDIAYTLEALGHQVLRLRDLVQVTAADDQVWRLAAEHACVLITCNRDDFLALAAGSDPTGLIILVRRRSRAHERAALVALLDRAGETGILHNVNFA
jgi:predicted nuclease of predicted toxin-antitoxin system